MSIRSPLLKCSIGLAIWLFGLFIIFLMFNGTGLVHTSLYLAILILVFTTSYFISNRKNKTELSRVFIFLARLGSVYLFITVTFALLLLYYYFLSSDMSIQYVWEYSARDHPLEYKFSGVIAGMSGSLLFWIWCMVFAWFVEEIRDLRRPRRTALMGLTRSVMMIIIIIFLYFLTSRDLFKETPSSWLASRPEGYGLNPLLQTPLMIIHPPIVFLAYGFIVMGMASAFAYLICRDKKWVEISMPWSRWGWLFLTLGIGIGGLWAYVVLGWGGYWAWDPVETSSFLPWLMLTAFLHAQLMFKRKGQFSLAAPAMGIYSFVLVIFATFATRAGGLWLSVHAFGQADIEINPWDRFVDIVNSDSIILGYFILMMGMAIIGALMLIWALFKWSTSEEGQASERRPKEFLEELINDKILMFITLILISLSTIVTLLMLILSVNGVDRNQFDTRVGFFAIVGVLVLTFCMAWRYLGRRITTYLVLLTGAISVILAMLFPEHQMVAVAMPALVLAAGACGIKIVKSVNPKSLRGSINGIAPHIVHLGLVFILIGFVASNFLETEGDITLTPGGPAQKVGEYEFVMTESAIDSDSAFVTVDITKGGQDVGTGEPGAVIIDGQNRNEISVTGTPTEDIYLVFGGGSTTSAGDSFSSVDLQVKILPLMSVLWLGMWLMAAGIFMRLMAEFARPKKKIEKERIKGRSERRKALRAEKEESAEEEEETIEPEERDEDYYDDLIERELEEM